MWNIEIHQDLTKLLQQLFQHYKVQRSCFCGQFTATTQGKEHIPPNKRKKQPGCNITMDYSAYKAVKRRNENTLSRNYQANSFYS